MKPYWKQVRADISKDSRGKRLPGALPKKSASEAVKRLDWRSMWTAHQLRVGGMSAQARWPTAVWNMAGFGFLDKYISDPDIEENSMAIAGGTLRSSRASGWHKSPGAFSFRPNHAEDTLRQKMVRLGGLVLDGTNPPIVDSYITQGNPHIGYDPAYHRTGAAVQYSVFAASAWQKITKQAACSNGRRRRRKCWISLSLCINYGVSIGLAGKTGSR